MPKSEYEKLSIEEKEKYWLEALKYKSDDDALTVDQWWIEWEPQLLYEDENLVLEKNYVNEFYLHKKGDDGGMTAGFEALLKYVDVGEVVGLDEYKGKSIVDYMRERGFPLTFNTWF